MQKFRLKLSLSVLFLFYTQVVSATGLHGLSPELVRELDQEFMDWEYLKPLTPEDLAEGYEVLKAFEGRGVSSESPTIILTAGAMASGKTTVFKYFADQKRMDFKKIVLIDPDEAKKILMAKHLSKFPDSKKTPSDFHLLSIYVIDMVLAWAMKQSVSCIYMTSLRHLESAEKLIDKVESRYPHYRKELVYIRAPLSTLPERNRSRAELESRRVPGHIPRIVPHDLLMASAHQVEQTVRKVRRRMHSFTHVRNDNFRSPVLHEISPLKKQRAVHLDFDWTAAYWIEPEEFPYINAADVVKIGNHFYRITDGVAEFIEVLKKIPDMVVFLTSGGPQMRNEDALRLIKASNGENNLFEVIDDVFSKHDLRDLETELDPKKRKKKDLSLLAPHIALSDQLLVDDLLGIIWPGHEDNLVHLGRTFRFVESWPNTTQLEDGKTPRRYMPTDDWSWRLERNKLAFAAGLILTAVKLSDKENISLVAAIKRLSYDSDGKRMDREDPRMFHYYKVGVDAMNGINPYWQKVGLPFRLACPQIIVNLGLPGL